MSKKVEAMQEPVIDPAVILGQLAIDRCKNHVTNLHTLIHMCSCGGQNIDDSVIESARIIIAGLELELDCSSGFLSKLDKNTVDG